MRDLAKSMVELGRRIPRCLHEKRFARVLPLSWIVVVLMGAVGIVAWNETRLTLQSSSEPTAIPLSHLFSAHDQVNRHIEVEGLLRPDLQVAIRPRSRWIVGPSFNYVALVGQDSRILLVRFDASLGPGKPRRVTLSGLIRAPELDLTRRMQSIGWKMAGFDVESRYVLVPGLAPRPLWLTIPIALIATSLACSLILYEIFTRIASRHPGKDSATFPTTS